MSDVILFQPSLTYAEGLQNLLFKPLLPLGLLSVSTFVEKEYEVKIIDQRIDKNWEKTLRKELNKRPICVGITCMTGPQIIHALKCSKIVKENNIPVIWGGIHPSLLPEQTLRNENVDIVIEGEGELAFYKVVKCLEKKKSLRGIHNVWYKENGKIRNNKRGPFLDLNELPDIPYHLVDVKNYLPKRFGVKALPLESSRGCPFSCAFCYNKLLNFNTWRCQTAEKVLERIKKINDELRIKGIFFVDDNFFVSPKRVEQIAKGIIKNKYDIKWELQGGHIKFLGNASGKYLKTLERSGLHRVAIGIESGSKRILNLIKKGITIRQVLKFNRKIKNYDIICFYNFIIGFPTESREDVRLTLELMNKLRKENKKARLQLFIYIPYPGTEIFNLSIKNGLKVPTTLEEWGDFSWDHPLVPWISYNDKKLFKFLQFLINFVDYKPNDLWNSRFLVCLANIYRPIAKLRVEKSFFKFMIEKKLVDLVVSKYRR